MEISACIRNGPGGHALTVATAGSTRPLVVSAGAGGRGSSVNGGELLMAALATDHGGRTWECTHLGGHRFAGNMVCLPDGVVYGRVTPADGPRLAA